MRVSIVITAHKTAEEIAGPLATLEPQRGDVDEILVIDDGSHPPLVLPDWVKTVRIERQPVYRNPSAAKNFGAKEASGDFLIFIDAGIYLLPDTLKSMVWVMENASPKPMITIQCLMLNGAPDLDEMEDRAAEMVQDTGFWTEHPLMMVEKKAFLGYDEETFTHWGFEAHDYDIRWLMAGGLIFSDVRRVRNGKRLVCFHPYHDAPRDKETAELQFFNKWGETWSMDMMRRAIWKFVDGIDGNS